MCSCTRAESSRNGRPPAEGTGPLYGDRVSRTSHLLRCPAFSAFENQADCLGQPRAIGGLTLELLTAVGGEAVELGVASWFRISSTRCRAGYAEPCCTLSSSREIS